MNLEEEFNKIVENFNLHDREDLSEKLDKLTEDSINYRDDDLAKELKKFLLENDHSEQNSGESAPNHLDSEKIDKWGEYKFDEDILKSVIIKDYKTNMAAEAQKTIESLLD